MSLLSQFEDSHDSSRAERESSDLAAGIRSRPGLRFRDYVFMTLSERRVFFS